VSKNSNYPRKNVRGETVWACCESSIGPVCGHLAPNPEPDPCSYTGCRGHYLALEVSEPVWCADHTNLADLYGPPIPRWWASEGFDFGTP
jgi:hypothetical protein